MTGRDQSRRHFGPTGAKGTAGHRRPAMARRRPSGAHSRPTLPTGAARPDDEIVESTEVTVVVPSEPPRLNSTAARALLRILIRAADQEAGPSGQAPGGGRTSGTQAQCRDEEARRAS